jgi:hypothetical protein
MVVRRAITKHILKLKTQNFTMIMKQLLTVALAMTLVACTASAQNVNIGVKAGLNVYTIHSDNDDADFNSMAGFHGGLLAHIHMSRQFAMQPEITYSSQGAKYTLGGDDFKTKLGYINVPVMFQYMFDNGFRLQAGPQLGILVSAKGEDENGNSLDIKDQLNTAEFALGVGAGYVHVPSGFGVDVRYNLGISNISKDDDAKAMNRGFQVGVFYLFKHK